MNRRAKVPLFLTFSPQAGRRNGRSSEFRTFVGSMRELFREILSQLSPRQAGRERDDKDAAWLCKGAPEIRAAT
jgi:hypothetical protein